MVQRVIWEQALLALFSAAAKTENENFVKERMLRSDGEQETVYIAAKIDSKVVGLGQIVISERHQCVERSAFIGFYVLGRYRQLGVGSTIMAGMLKVLEKYDVEKILALVDSGNRTAISFYKKFGFNEDSAGNLNLLENECVMSRKSSIQTRLETGSQVTIEILSALNNDTPS
jgi:ribosomal protein S18 acetylase RimI-like enzyme